MPIRKDLLHFYRTPAWKAARRLVLERARRQCEQCGRPNHLEVVLRSRPEDPLAVTEGQVAYLPGQKVGLARTAEVRMLWRNPKGPIHWMTNLGWPARLADYEQAMMWPLKRSRTMLNVAHLNHTPGDDRLENLRALCGWCHLNYDKTHHKQTRSKRKDAARPLIREATNG